MTARRRPVLAIIVLLAFLTVWCGVFAGVVVEMGWRGGLRLIGLMLIWGLLMLAGFLAVQAVNARLNKWPAVALWSALLPVSILAFPLLLRRVVVADAIAILAIYVAVPVVIYGLGNAVACGWKRESVSTEGRARQGPPDA